MTSMANLIEYMKIEHIYDIICDKNNFNNFLNRTSFKPEKYFNQKKIYYKHDLGWQFTEYAKKKKSIVDILNEYYNDDWDLVSVKESSLLENYDSCSSIHYRVETIYTLKRDINEHFDKLLSMYDVEAELARLRNF